MSENRYRQMMEGAVPPELKARTLEAMEREARRAETAGTEKNAGMGRNAPAARKVLPFRMRRGMAALAGAAAACVILFLAVWMNGQGAEQSVYVYGAGRPSWAAGAEAQDGLYFQGGIRVREPWDRQEFEAWSGEKLELSGLPEGTEEVSAEAGGYYRSGQEPAGADASVVYEGPDGQRFTLEYRTGLPEGFEGNTALSGRAVWIYEEDGGYGALFAGQKQELTGEIRAENTDREVFEEILKNFFEDPATGQGFTDF